MTVAAAPVSRRTRQRESTVAEIVSVARASVVASGAAGLSLRAVAREMGMTAPALYRYFPSREALLETLVADVYDTITAALVRARDAEAPDEPGRRLVAVSRAFRAWAVAHPEEFALSFGAPLPGFSAPPEGPADEACVRFGSVFAELFAQLWARKPFPVRPIRDAQLSEQLATYGAALGGALPVEAVKVFLECWVRLFGQVSLETFGHLSFAMIDPAPLFEETLREVADQLDAASSYFPPRD